jgi:hypothetical protein
VRSRFYPSVIAAEHLCEFGPQPLDQEFKSYLTVSLTANYRGISRNETWLGRVSECPEPGLILLAFPSCQLVLQNLHSLWQTDK